MKKIIVLLLVAVMCLSLVACGDGSGNAETPTGGENTNNQSGDNNQTQQNKFERGTKTTTDNPLFSILRKKVSENTTLNDDGTCPDGKYWWIEEDTENSITIYISSEYELKRSYQLKRYTDINDNKNIAYLFVREPIYWQGELADWLEGGAISVPCFEIHPLYSTLIDVICSEWKSTDKSAIFYENGTCIIGEENLIWEFGDIFWETDTDSKGYTDLAIIGLETQSGNAHSSLTISVHKDGYYKIDDMFLAK